MNFLTNLPLEFKISIPSDVLDLGSVLEHGHQSTGTLKHLVHAIVRYPGAPFTALILGILVRIECSARSCG